MTLFGWTDADPVQVADAIDYEMGTEFLTTTDLTLTHVRIFSGPGPIDLASRRGRIWTIGGLQLGQATMPTTLTPGWTLHALDEPVALPSGTRFIVSAGIGGNYAAIANAFQLAQHVSSNGALISRKASDAANGNGIFNNTPNNFPTSNFNSTFYGIDVGYELGIGGNTAPVITNLALSASGLTVSASATVTDAETLAGATFSLDWGDGSTSSASAASHTYASAGVKAVMASVTDAGGLFDYYASAILLEPPAVAGALHPSTELVTVAWLKAAVPYLGNRVATVLPTDNASWSASGFTVISGTGGTPDIDLEVSRPMVSIDCYAVAPNDGSKPPWNLAFQLGEEIKRAMLRDKVTGSAHRVLTLPAAYKQARVFTIIPRSEPRRLPGDVGNYAHVQMDAEIWWVEI